MAGLRCLAILGNRSQRIDFQKFPPENHIELGFLIIKAIQIITNTCSSQANTKTAPSLHIHTLFLLETQTLTANGIVSTDSSWLI